MSSCGIDDGAGTTASMRGLDGIVGGRDARGSVWLQYPRPCADPALRLFCFPHAGSGASAYRQWPPHMPPGVEICAIQLPGRESRFTEPAFDSAERVVDALLPSLTPRLGRPFAFFGHSMGALLAYETATRLQQRGGPMPVQLLVSGCGAPHVPDRATRLKALPDDAFVAELRRMQGMPEEIIANAELMQVLLPTLRADTALCENYARDARSPLCCPIAAYGGLEDHRVEPAAVEAWRAHTASVFTARMFTGGHFFIRSIDAIRAVAADLTSLEEAMA